METGKNIWYTQRLLCETIELLDDAYSNLGLFQRHHYVHLKKCFEQHLAANKELQEVFNTINPQQ